MTTRIDQLKERIAVLKGRLSYSRQYRLLNGSLSAKEYLEVQELELLQDIDFLEELLREWENKTLWMDN